MAKNPRTKRPQLIEFFLDGEGIHQHVFQQEIGTYMGPEAFSKPAIYKGRRGYIITALRPMTEAMVDDLRRLSEEYVKESLEVEQKRHEAVGVSFGGWGALM